MTRNQIIAAGIIIVAALILGLTKFKLPLISSNTQTPMPKSTSNQAGPAYAFPGKLPDERISNRQARIATSRGEIVASLDAFQAPLAVSNFVYLAELGFYDGIRWHRAESWVVQAGDPQTKDSSTNPALWGTGGPGYTFEDEPVNGTYSEGTVAMANAGPNTNGSQFFIMRQARNLDPAYTIFGRVISGMEVVQALIKNDQIERITIEPAT